MSKLFAGFCTIGSYAIVNLWYPSRDEYYSFTELYKAFKQLYFSALGGKG